MNRTPVRTTCRPSLLLAGMLASLLVCGLAAQAPAVAMPPVAPSAINIPFETYTLPNGLTVILSQDTTTPTVAVNVWYHVGSKNEAAGPHRLRAPVRARDVHRLGPRARTALHDKLTEGVGGTNNGTTSNDRTTYFETVPIELPRIGALARSRSHGLPARLARCREAERPARHRQERAAPERRQPALRPRRRDPRRGDLPADRTRIRGTSSAAWRISRRPRRRT